MRERQQSSIPPSSGSGSIGDELALFGLCAETTAVELLIHSIVQQTTVLIAQLATTGGARAPLEKITERLFSDIARELKQRGVSAKVSADMFGLSLRTYQRKLTRMRKRLPRRATSLREAILQLVKTEGAITRAEILRRFPIDSARQIKAVLRDLGNNRLLLASGRGEETAFSCPPEAENAGTGSPRWQESVDARVVALVFGRGPLSASAVAEQLGSELSAVESALARLSAAGRIEVLDRAEGRTYRATTLEIPLRTAGGWEAAVRDHFSALVATVVARLAPDLAPELQGRIGGSTYALDLGLEHPMAEEVYGTLARFRTAMAELQARLAKVQTQDAPAFPRTRVLIYLGQCVLDRPHPGPEAQPVTQS